MVKDAHTSSRQFFEETSPTEKQLLSFHTEGVGYTCWGDRSREGFVVHLPSPGMPFPWPAHPDSFETHVVTYFELMEKGKFFERVTHVTVGREILSLIELALNLPPCLLSHHLDTDSNNFRAYSNSVLFIRHYLNSQPRTSTNSDYTGNHTDRFVSIVCTKALQWTSDFETSEWGIGVRSIFLFLCRIFLFIIFSVS